MSETTMIQVAQLEKMTVDQLGERFEDLFSEPTRSRHKRYLIRRIAWRLQANAEGGLSVRALKRVEELAQEAEIRVTAPRTKPDDDAPMILRMETARDPRLPPQGNWIQRDYKGRTISVLVLFEEFEYEGKRFRSLSAIAKHVTGSHVNGFQFFRLRSAK